jgi:hypothetical protein
MLVFVIDFNHFLVISNIVQNLTLFKTNELIFTQI